MTRDELHRAIAATSPTHDGSGVVTVAITELQIVRAAAAAHLPSLPAVEEVETWIVTYWSLSQHCVVSTVMATEADADRCVRGKGPTARKHRVPALTWVDPPGSGA